MKLIVFLLMISVVFSCKMDSKSETVEESSAAPVEFFGDSISTDGAISVDEAIQVLANKDSVMTTINGYVTSVCQVKGCWMVLSQNKEDSTGLFVKFRDYSFFMPLDLAGSKVCMEGKAFKELTPVDELKHYAEDEGKSQEEIDAITEPKVEMKFMANGVVVLQRDTL